MYPFLILTRTPFNKLGPRLKDSFKFNILFSHICFLMLYFFMICRFKVPNSSAESPVFTKIKESSRIRNKNKVWSYDIFEYLEYIDFIASAQLEQTIKFWFMSSSLYRHIYGFVDFFKLNLQTYICGNWSQNSELGWNNICVFIW